MRMAAAALTAANTFDGLRAVLRAAGFTESAGTLDPDQRLAIGLAETADAELFAGPGLVRVLVLRFGTEGSLRESIQRVARRVGARAPHVLWLVAAMDARGTEAALAAFAPDAGPRVSSFLWEPDGVVASDAETLCALSAVRDDEDALFHVRCGEVLGRDSLTRRFYRVLRGRVDALADALPRSVARSDARAVALLYTSRLLFLRFLEAKSWLDGDRGFLAARFDACMRDGGGFHRHVLLPLFFGTLNTPVARRASAARRFGRVPFLNGGLFSRSVAERRVGRWRFPDEVLGSLFGELFQRFRFVAREDSASWSEASVDPEMLGRAFESLMAHGDRQSGGVYYTPHALVARVAEQALLAAVPVPSLGRLRELRVLDPACGSGAFLVYLLERIAALRRSAGDEASLASIRRDVLARSIFGVDLDATAVWLCELRLWLSVVIESEEDDPLRVAPLPNLDRNVRVGDALVGQGFTASAAAIVGSARIESLRARYVRATGKRKQTLAAALDREERRRALAQVDHEIEVARHARRERLEALRARDLFGERTPRTPELERALTQARERMRELRLERRRLATGGALPFSFHACFASAGARGGFDVVVGNPPWVRLHRVPERMRRQLRAGYEVYRSAAWKRGATGGRASPGFAAQVDLAALFVERSIALLRERGVVSLLLPSKLWRSLAGGGVRGYVQERAELLRLEDLSESKHAFEAAVYPSLMVARLGHPSGSPVTVAIHDRRAFREWTIPLGALPLDDSPGAPWLLLTPEARHAFDAMARAGVPLSHSAFGAPRLGVKSGCNAAFVVRVTDTARDFATVIDPDGESGSVELTLLRPALRGDGVAPWTRPPCAEWIVWTHDPAGAPLGRLPDRARAWLRRRYSDLSRRTDATRARRWWSLFRVDGANTASPRVVWADIGRRPRAAVLAAGDPTVPLNSCYVIRCADDVDAWALAALLNSPLAAAWLNAIAEPARGGYRRYLGWTVGLLPIPRDWTRARTLLAEARFGDDDRLLDATLAAFRLARPEVASLLQWTR
jgi:hypothetical protein